MYLIIITIILLIIILLILRVWSNKKSKRLISPSQPWGSLIHQFKSVAPEFKTVQELEDYLLMIKEEVKNYETDYAFLSEFNNVIRQARQDLKLK
jgi:hypothetical protein